MENSKVNNLIKKLENELSILLSDSCDIVDRSIFLKLERIDKINGLEINIYSDHGYPHFHLKANNPKINCKIKISDLTFISGEDQLSAKNKKKLQVWYNSDFMESGITGKEKLEEIWAKHNLVVG